VKRIALFAALALSGCAGVPTLTPPVLPPSATPTITPPPAPVTAVSNTPAEVVYAAAASLSQAEVLAKAYMQSSIADPAVVAEIKTLDNAAYSAIQPVLDDAAAGKSVISAVEASAATAALNALTSYLATNSITAGAK
jgi:hypothetical protein